MDIKTLEIRKINPAPYNPRKDLKPGDLDYEKLKKSIDEFDMVEPLIWNERSGNLVGGHQRLKILKARGDTEVEVSVVDLDDVKEKALNLALNKISGEWDFPMLKDLLEELDTGDFDMEITGFDLKEIEDLMSQFHVPEDGLTDDDAVPEATESISKRGDLWVLGNHRLLCGDATVITDVERLMGGEKADMVFADPPYGISVVQTSPHLSGTYPIGKIGFSRMAKAHNYKPVIGDDKPFNPEHLLKLAPLCILFGANNYASKLPDMPHWLVWDKHNGMESLDHTFFGDAEILWTNIPNRKSVRIYRFLWKGMHQEGKREERVHPTQKPTGLLIAVMKDYPVNKILDPYGGSGSTLIACEKLGRRCFMMEISEMYCDVIRTRWEQFTGKQAVLVSGATDV